MPNVVADTSCLIVLDKIEGLFVLEQMYGNLLVTPTVKSEYGKELPALLKCVRSGIPTTERSCAAYSIPEKRAAWHLPLRWKTRWLFSTTEKPVVLLRKPGFLSQVRWG